MKKLIMTYDGGSRITISTNLPFKITTYSVSECLTTISFTYRCTAKELTDLETIPREVQGFLEDLKVDSLKFKECKGNNYVQTLVFNVYTVYKVDLKVSEGSEDADPVQTLTIYLAPYLLQIEPDYEPNA